MWEKYFRIANHSFCVRGANLEGENLFPVGFEIFGITNVGLDLPLFTLETGIPLTADAAPSQHSFPFEDLDLNCEFVADEDGFEFRMLPNVAASPIKPAFTFLPNRSEISPILLKMPRLGHLFRTNIHPDEETVSEFRFLIWKAFGIAVAPFATLAIHASVIVFEGKAVLFLGESGTGKSTHTRLWLQYIVGSRLLNDDSPIVRIIDGSPLCFGSPWSGKGNCFQNRSFPIAAIIRLRQAPFNKIRLLAKMEAFGALYPSCPPTFSVDSDLTDQLCNTLSTIIQKIPVFQLDCLPDAVAARLACAAVFNADTLNNEIADGTR